MVDKDSVIAWTIFTKNVLGQRQAAQLEEIIGNLALKRFEDLPINLIFCGGPGTGKSTILEIICKMFPDLIIYSSSEFALHSHANGLIDKIHVIHDFDYAHHLFNGGGKCWTHPMIFGATNQPYERFVPIMPHGATFMKMLGNRFSKDTYFGLLSKIYDDLPAIIEYCKRCIIFE